jgi:hypothetical protein
LRAFRNNCRIVKFVKILLSKAVSAPAVGDGFLLDFPQLFTAFSVFYTVQHTPCQSIYPHHIGFFSLH